ncbi:Rossmann-fold NAD(P)-binding domain-containing protein [Brucella thiophenivorans]|uniref:NADH(P)-binding family protein n=1 Tax=Brucella thiophenivorans TaxID=571255 RepID=A0A256F977_9HYPH|nr:hypothetical protein [Brucella thiophenivorans]OYR11404.1 NADH(P)-binding family protein [Brucella thiophenivorans]
MSTLLIFGASRGVGLELARHACANGRSVVAMVRAGSDATALSETGAQIIRGNAFALKMLRAPLRSLA